MNNQSECNLRSEIEKIGYHDIVKYGDTEKLLDCFSDFDFVHYLCKDNKRDAKKIAKDIIDINSSPNHIGLENKDTLPKFMPFKFALFATIGCVIIVTFIAYDLFIT